MRRTTPPACLAMGGVLLAPALVVAFFEQPEVISSSGGPTMVVGGDFDGDGTVDLAVSARSTGRVYIFPGRGDGTFRFPRGLDVGGQPTVLTTADVDRNGALDIVWADEPSGDVGVIYQMRTNPVSYGIEVFAGADEPRDVIAADLDDDEWPEVITANYGADLVSVYPNLAGTLGPPQLHDVGDGPAALVSLKADAFVRFAVVQSGALSTDVGLYDEAFEPVQILPIEDPAGITLVDWDGDAFPDITITDRAGSGHVYVADAGGLLTSQVSWDLAPSASSVVSFRTTAGEPGAVVLEKNHNRVVLCARTTPSAVEVLAGYFVGQNAGRFLWQDLDGDLAEELVVPLPDEQVLLVVGREGDRLRGIPSFLSGRFPQQVEIAGAAAGLPPRVAVLCPTSHDLWVYEITDGRLQLSTILPVPVLARRFRWASLDGDDLPDLVVLDIENGFSVYRAQGAGFAPPQVVNVSGDFRDLVVLPWGNGLQTDVILTDGTLRGLRVFSSDGGGGFTEDDFVDCRHTPVVAGAIDLDEDGFEDVVTLGTGSTLCISYNGPGGLDQQTIFTLGDEPRGLAFGNFNGDELPDIGVGNAGDETFTVLVSLLPRLYGLGAQNQVTPSGSQTAEALDVNNDGKDDLVFTSLASRSISIHAGLGNGAFTVPSRIRCSSLPFDMARFDIDGDQQIDLLVLDTLGDAVVALLTTGGAAAAPEPTPAAPPVQTARLFLAPLYPNPSDGIVNVRLRAPGELAPVARVYDLRGRKVADLRVRPEQDGWFTARWDGRDAQGRTVARGRYLVQLRAGGGRAARAVMLR